MAAGPRNRRIELQRAFVTDDALGGESEAWETVAVAWANVRFGSGAERRQAAQESAGQAATFAVLLNPVTAGIGVTDRIRFMEADWDIQGAAPDDAGAQMVFAAVRAA